MKLLSMILILITIAQISNARDLGNKYSCVHISGPPYIGLDLDVDNHVANLQFIETRQGSWSSEFPFYDIAEVSPTSEAKEFCHSDNGQFLGVKKQYSGEGFNLTICKANHSRIVFGLLKTKTPISIHEPVTCEHSGSGW